MLGDAVHGIGVVAVVREEDVVVPVHTGKYRRSLRRTSDGR